MDKKSAIVTGVFFSMLVLTGFVSFLATRGSQAEEEKLPVQKNFLTTSDPKSPFSLDVKDVAELQSLTAAQKSDVKSLTISDTELEVLESETLRGFHNLQALKFAGGYLMNISEGAFDDLKNLKRLDLSENEVEALSEEFKKLINLEELDLDGTYVDEYEEDPFYHLANLTSLKYLNLAQLDFDFGFPKLIPQSLVTLDLRKVLLGEDITYLKNLKNLYAEEIGIFGNSTAIPDSLERMHMYNAYSDEALRLIRIQKNLKYLNIGRNAMNNVSVSAFYDGVLNTKVCENLLELNISNIYGRIIQHLPENAFEKCPNLQVLDLSVLRPQNTTGLNELKSAWFEHNPNLQVVKLFNNRFDCQAETFEQELERLKKNSFVLQDSDGKVVFRDQWKQHLCTVKTTESRRHHHHHHH